MGTPAEFSWPLISFPPPPAGDIAGVPGLAPGFTTLSDLIRIIRQRTDTQSSDIVTDDELTDSIRLSANELYDLLIGAYEDYAVVLPPYELTTDGSTDYYPLPPEFYKLLGLDWQPGGGSLAQNVTMRRFNMGERNRFALGFLPALSPGGVPCRYKVIGNKLWLNPRPSANLKLLVYYAPRLRPLSNVGSVLLNFTSVSALPVDSIFGVTRYVDGTSDGAWGGLRKRQTSAPGRSSSGPRSSRRPPTSPRRSTATHRRSRTRRTRAEPRSAS
jgi:hypothetical protein